MSHGVKHVTRACWGVRYGNDDGRREMLEELDKELKAERARWGLRPAAAAASACTW
jgi:hypothetical protein